jgi:hypothetical protein
MPAPTTRVPSVLVTVCEHDSSSRDLMPVDNSRVPSALTPTPAPILLPHPDGHKDTPPPAEPPPAEPPAEPPPDAPAGSLWAHILLDPSRPHSPSTPFEFPLDPDNHHTPPANAPGPLVLRHADLPEFSSIMDSVLIIPTSLACSNRSRSEYLGTYLSSYYGNTPPQSYVW